MERIAVRIAAPRSDLSVREANGCRFRSPGSPRRYFRSRLYERNAKRVYRRAKAAPSAFRSGSE